MADLPDDLGRWPIYRGDAWSLPIADTTDDQPTDWSTFGDTFQCYLRTDPDAADFIEADVDISTPGVMVVSLTGLQTEVMLDGQTYTGDVQVSGGAVSPRTLFTFQAPVDADVTHG